MSLTSPKGKSAPVSKEKQEKDILLGHITIQKDELTQIQDAIKELPDKRGELADVKIELAAIKLELTDLEKQKAIKFKEFEALKQKHDRELELQQTRLENQKLLLSDAQQATAEENVKLSNIKLNVLSAREELQRLETQKEETIKQSEKVIEERISILADISSKYSKINDQVSVASEQKITVTKELNDLEEEASIRRGTNSSLKIQTVELEKSIAEAKDELGKVRAETKIEIDDLQHRSKAAEAKFDERSKELDKREEDLEWREKNLQAKKVALIQAKKQVEEARGKQLPQIVIE
jgi:chromosome segregation ATPase